MFQNFEIQINKVEDAGAVSIVTKVEDIEYYCFKTLFFKILDLSRKIQP